jgi:Ca-activated chloride channel family protein
MSKSVEAHRPACSRHPLSASAILALAGVLSVFVPSVLAAPVRQISVQVSVVTVPVTVTNARGDFVGSLERNDFRLWVDDAEQPIEYFASEEEPAQVLVLVETGPAVYLLRREHIAAAGALLAGLGADDRVAVAGYSEKPQLLLDFTANKQQAASSLNGLNYGLGIAGLNFYDSLASVVDWVESGSAGGKRAIVVLTTGLDSSGAGPWQHLLDRLQTSNVLVLPVGLGGDLRTSDARVTRPGGKLSKGPAQIGEEMSFAESSRALEAIAQETGGRVFYPRSPRDFEDAYRRIASLVRHQYSLGFTAPAADGRYHAIRVEVLSDRSRVAAGKARAPAYRVNARRGFLAPGTAP